MTTKTAASGAPDLTALIHRLYQLETDKKLDEWMALWDPAFEITFPLATHPPIASVRGLDNLREITRQKMIDRVRIELGIKVAPMADPLKALVFLDVVHHFADGSRREIALVCLFTFTAAGRIVGLAEYFNQAPV